MKTTIVLIVTGCLLSPLYADKVSDIPFAENINSATKERTFYNKGFKDGKEIGLREGYAKARKDMLKLLQRYANKIKAYEAGKYLSQKGKVTPPRVYQRRGSDGKVEIFIKGCELRGELKPSDILKFPILQETAQDTVATPSLKTLNDNSPYSDGVYLNGIDRQNTAIATPTQSLKQVNSIVLQDTRFYRDLLRTSSILYSIENGGGGLKAIFKNEREKHSFVKNYGLEYGKDYR